MAIAFVLKELDSGWLEVPGSSQESGVRVQTQRFTGGLNQQWFLNPVTMPGFEPTPFYQIQNRASNLILALNGGHLDPGTQIIQLEDAADEGQLWRFENADLSQELAPWQAFLIHPKLLDSTGAISVAKNGLVDLAFPEGSGHNVGEWYIEPFDFAAQDVPPIQVGLEAGP